MTDSLKAAGPVPGPARRARRDRGARIALLGLLGLGCAACSGEPGNPHHPGLAKLCAPAGTAFAQPDGGAAILHPLDEPPVRVDGDWEVSTLEAAGIDPEPIGDMLRAVEDRTYTGIDGILIARHRQLVFEAYFDGFDRDAVHNIRSAFKSFLSTLVGIAIDRRLIAGLAQPISTFFPDRWADIATPDPRKERITLGHLLTMTPGFDRQRGLDDADDWYRFALDQPMAHEPGAAFGYNDANSMLIGGAVAWASGQPFADFAKATLFDPLGITRYCWTFTPAGQPMTDGSFYMRPRDFAKLGQLYLDGGMWRGRRVVSAAWVRAATRHQIALPPPTTRKLHVHYGYHWWVRNVRPHDDHSFAMYTASGGSQKLVVFPDLEMVVVFTGSRYVDRAAYQQPWEMLDRYILPALRDGAPNGLGH